MPTFCAVVNCGSVGGKGIPMYRFPSKFDNRGRICKISCERLEKWISALKREDLTESKIKYERVCGRHFISGTKANLNDVSNPDWVPSINMGYERPSSSKPLCLERFQRLKHRKRQIQPDNIILRVDGESGINEYENLENESVQTVTTDEMSVNDLKLALINANEEIYKLREEVEYYKYNRNTLVTSDTKCSYYTGLPNVKYVDGVFNLVEKYLNETHSSKLSKYEQLILTLMKLRKNFDFTEWGINLK